MERKSDKVRRLVAEGNYKEALAIAKGFRLSIQRDDWRQMTKAYECMVHKDFYLSLGNDLEKEIANGIRILIHYYGGEKNDKG